MWKNFIFHQQQQRSISSKNIVIIPKFTLLLKSTFFKKYHSRILGQCANSCLPLQKQFVCSLKCEDSCDQKKCKTDITGERPSCRSDVSVISGGIIAAIVISIQILVSLMVMLFCLIKRRKQKEKEKEVRQSGILRVELVGL
ncbi:Hypothetical_protein [Hexamita inflata]|uniref:Hypothetical_protein n=1 Tax=Hexamita inflata TaxID=28002 RepID=A0AA86T8S8_9EUKA|nr:Hypothetical protein HINF_LOCUS119 [Hexamita inflata]